MCLITVHFKNIFCFYLGLPWNVCNVNELVINKELLYSTRSMHKYTSTVGGAAQLGKSRFCCTCRKHSCIVGRAEHLGKSRFFCICRKHSYITIKCCVCGVKLAITIYISFLWFHVPLMAVTLNSTWQFVLGLHMRTSFGKGSK